MPEPKKYQRSANGKKGWRVQVSNGRKDSGAQDIRTRVFYPDCANPWGHEGRRQARQDALEFATQLGRTKDADRKKVRLSFIMNEYIEHSTTKAANPWSPKTLENHLMWSARIVDWFDDRPISEIQPNDIGEFVAWLQTPSARKHPKKDKKGNLMGLTSSSAQRAHDVLRAGLAYAVEEEYLDHSPIKKKHRPKKEVTEPPVPTDDEVRRMLLHLQSAPIWYTFFHLATTTGARRGELIGIQWGDILSKRMQIRIARSVGYASREVHVKLPKNGRVRETDVGPAVFATLDQWKSHASSTFGVEVESDWYLFANEPGADPVHPEFVKRWWTRQRSEVDYMAPYNFHKMRHYVGTTLAESGMGFTEIAQQLGHASPAMAAQIYAHARKRGLSRAAEVMGDALGDLPGFTS